MASTIFRVLTVVVNNINRVLIFREADSPALGQTHQHHGGTKQRKPHGWWKMSTTFVATPFNYLQNRNMAMDFSSMGQ